MTERLTFKGIVQGIGFRPTALRLAIQLKIKGQVKNSGGNVEIIINGNRQALNDFVQRLIDTFEIKEYKRTIIDDIFFEDFKIVSSTKDNELAFITPDLATCSDCEKELLDKNNRRYAHPFISCVNCGPRYTIIKTLPYDRENTTMSPFEMCDECDNEYKLPSDRRCHAQTIACHDCGPKTNISIDEAINILKNGDILAIKDIGGYHLSCMTNDVKSILKIRKLKGRETKPFAVMFSSVDEIKQYCKVNDEEEKLLLSSARPIVLLEKIKDFDESVCGDSKYIGAFLPCNPIQIMILNSVSPLIMTSANISGEPIITDDEKVKKFGVKILSHNREILTPIDDSVLRINAKKPQFIRRARGYTPLSIDIGIKAKKDTLCLGGDLKAVFGYHKDKYVYLSQYFGDLDNISCFESFKKNIDRFGKLHTINKDIIIADAHPDYYSSNLYKNYSTVQHHKAHIASVIAENQLKGDIIGFAFDGTGYGDDGAVWGSECFLFNGKTFERKEHLKYTKMTASDEISKDARLALACYIGGNNIIEQAQKNNINMINSSSMGRLFDAVASLLDVCHYNDYEGKCATMLEALASTATKSYPLTPTWNPTEILYEIKNAHALKNELALGFHYMIAQLILDTVKKYNVQKVVLSGGVFNNKVLLERTCEILEENNFNVYTNRLTPCGDGCIALGQAYINAIQ